eukprot:gnl/TRDRNA2_/TRDRNA2_193132_c0_seq1.p1 gnl/TRDRNA2_/TRDRNA2_193132_c0~~gnl/TRDRNA2_/TRDRNA2_193132_c0_seq1.p1  ORF type:complete len:332 (-),score=23.97 gnl/TRDRNA2_/TRDRNA2_193132_c0_seq1:103-1038(-)
MCVANLLPLVVLGSTALRIPSDPNPYFRGQQNETIDEQQIGEAFDEANLPCANVSTFAASIRKWPKSQVDCIIALRKGIGSAKTHNYNFQGSLEAPGTTWWRPNNRRLWILDFAKKHFADIDFLRLTDVTEDYVRLGAFDHTVPHTPTHKARKSLKPCHKYVNDEYYQTMIQSNFTLAPGGDHAYSWRFFEAILAGSIPLINSMEEDFGGIESFLPRKLGYRVFTVREIEGIRNLTRSRTKINMIQGIRDLTRARMKIIADENFRLFIKYQTFLEGDNVPPQLVGWKNMEKPCTDDVHCNNRLKGHCKKEP